MKKIYTKFSTMIFKIRPPPKKNKIRPFTKFFFKKFIFTEFFRLIMDILSKTTDNIIDHLKY